MDEEKKKEFWARYEGDRRSDKRDRRQLIKGIAIGVLALVVLNWVVTCAVILTRSGDPVS